MRFSQKSIWFQIPIDTNLIKTEHDLPYKKNKIEEYFTHLPYNMTQFQQMYAALDPLYAAQYVHVSAFKPVPQCLKEGIRHGLGLGRYMDPPVLQHPERVIPLSESERFERSFQPNVALAPPLPKKYR